MKRGPKFPLALPCQGKPKVGRGVHTFSCACSVPQADVIFCSRCGVSQDGHGSLTCGPHVIPENCKRLGLRLYNALLRTLTREHRHLLCAEKMATAEDHSFLGLFSFPSPRLEQSLHLTSIISAPAFSSPRAGWPRTCPTGSPRDNPVSCSVLS